MSALVISASSWESAFHELDRTTFLWVVAATTISALPLLLVRLFRVAIRLDSSSAGSVERFQFTIRHLLTLTFVVACLISIRNCVEPYAIELVETPDGVVSDYFDEAVYYWLFPAAVVGVLGILPVWFVLATKQLVLSCVGLLAAGVCAGYWLGRFYDDPSSLCDDRHNHGGGGGGCFAACRPVMWIPAGAIASKASQRGPRPSRSVGQRREVSLMQAGLLRRPLARCRPCYEVSLAPDHHADARRLMPVLGVERFVL